VLCRGLTWQSFGKGRFCEMMDTRVKPACDEIWQSRPYATAGTGSAVTDLIFSIAKREVTFFSGTVAISFL
jgi:hypothetical protein